MKSTQFTRHRVYSVLAIWIYCALIRGLAQETGLHQLGRPFEPKEAVLVWQATNELPKKVLVYRVVPTNYPVALISNLLGVARLSENDRATPMGEGVFKERTVRYYRSQDQSRFLGFFPSQGWIIYKDNKGLNKTKEKSVGVPDLGRAMDLSWNYFKMLGLNEKDLVHRGGDALDFVHSTRERMRPLSANPEKESLAQYLYFKRQINGVSFTGPGMSAGIWIGFGEKEKLSDLQIVWRNLVPLHQRPAIQRDKIIETIKRGEAVIQFQNPDTIQTVTITNTALYYLSEPGNVRQKVVRPVYALESEVEAQGKKAPASLWIWASEE